MRVKGPRPAKVTFFRQLAACFGLDFASQQDRG